MSPIRHILACVLAVVALCASCAPCAWSSEHRRSAGSRPEFPREAAKAKPRAGGGGTYQMVADLPPAIDLSSSFPAPLNQGYLGSCVAWASAYALKSYYEKIDHGWAMNADSQKFCANFIYNQVNGGRDGGSYVSDNFLILAQRGCATIADQPYSWTDYQTWPSAAQCSAALNYRNGLVSGLPYGWVARSDLTGIKTKLAEGTPFVMTMAVDQAWDYLNATKNYVWHPNNNSVRGWHAIAVIGYDDTVTDGAGHVGALKIQNSWGPNWASGGRAWVAYSALSTSAVGGAFYFCADRRSYTASITGRVTIAHPKRGQVTITAGVGSPSAPAWSYRFYDAMYMIDSGNSNIDTTIDLSDASAFWPPSEARPWWIKIGDTVSDSSNGRLFAGTVTQGATSYACVTPLPLSIPDSGNATASIVGAVALTPVLLSPLRVSAVVGRSFTYTILARNSPSSFLATGLPTGLSVNAATGVISGAPTAVATSNVTISAVNSTGTTSATLVITVLGQAPAITSSVQANATVSSRFGFRLCASNSATSFAVTNMPPGLRLNAVTGCITGVPRSAGSYSMKVSASNSSGSGSLTMKIVVAGAALGAPVFSSSVLVSGRVGSAFSYRATGTNTPTAFASVGMPAGLTLNSTTGYITGTPSVSGTYNVRIAETNSRGTSTTTTVLAISAVSTSAPVAKAGGQGSAAGG
jgi:hypothetical protein